MSTLWLLCRYCSIEAADCKTKCCCGCCIGKIGQVSGQARSLDKQAPSKVWYSNSHSKVLVHEHQWVCIYSALMKNVVSSYLIVNNLHCTMWCRCNETYLFSWHCFHTETSIDPCTSCEWEMFNACFLLKCICGYSLAACTHSGVITVLWAPIDECVNGVEEVGHAVSPVCGSILYTVRFVQAN